MDRVNKPGFAAVIIGVATTIFAPLSPGWTLALGVLVLGLGIAAIVEVLPPRKPA